MLDWLPDWSMLAVQALLALATVEIMRTRVLGAVASINDPSLILDVWGPLTLVVPLMFFLWRVDSGVGGAGWLPFGAPVVIGWTAVAGAFLVAGRGGSTHQSQPLSIRTLVIWSSVGLIMLLLGAAHDLTLWMGQCAFAGAAVLLWINTPAEAAHSEDLAPAHIRAGTGVSIALVLAIAQGATSIAVPSELAPLSGAIMVASAMMIVLAAAALGGPHIALRLGGWAATFGVLFSLGTFTLAKLLPHAWMAVRDSLARAEGVPMLRRIAWGFGHFALEALMLMLLPIAASARTFLSVTAQRRIGAAILTAAAVLTAWRLSSI